ncbi:alpha/beta hydrolase [Mangrovactinospora gilvigrisea]|uniref:Alpha/beta hydrolase n=1 Tax=Mangrovactinospora gilvigrisea TaxID=1428644 RepID=A0A1J7C1T2_9ACTN|nr:alpha/beta hydrolase [Mangrovactinospora gilvigrisea]OIV35548.1 alpha/beta hydrolase [Mangrovactinospora gilvigrisea]
MATFVLIPGASAGPWYWHLLEDELRARGHESVAVDLPNEDDAAGLAEYADAVVAAIGAAGGGGGGGGDGGGGAGDVVLVAHSLGGFTAPLVCERVPVALLVMLQAMVPAPGESAGEWWANTGYPAARSERDARDGRAPDDELALFYTDTPRELVEESQRHGRGQSGTPFAKPWPLTSWPDVPTRFLLARDDPFFPAPFLRAVVRDRLGITPDEMPGDHCPMLGHPTDLATRLIAYHAEL